MKNSLGTLGNSNPKKLKRELSSGKLNNLNNSMSMSSIENVKKFNKTRNK